MFSGVAQAAGKLYVMKSLSDNVRDYSDWHPFSRYQQLDIIVPGMKNPEDVTAAKRGYVSPYVLDADRGQSQIWIILNPNERRQQISKSFTLGQVAAGTLSMSSQTELLFLLIGRAIDSIQDRRETQLGCRLQNAYIMC